MGEGYGVRIGRIFVTVTDRAPFSILQPLHCSLLYCPPVAYWSPPVAYWSLLVAYGRLLVAVECASDFTPSCRCEGPLHELLGQGEGSRGLISRPLCATSSPAGAGGETWPPKQTLQIPRRGSVQRAPTGRREYLKLGARALFYYYFRRQKRRTCPQPPPPIATPTPRELYCNRAQSTATRPLES